MIKKKENTQCNCIQGENCACNNPTHLPPIPSQQPPVGFQWVYNASAMRWIPQRVAYAGDTVGGSVFNSFRSNEFIANTITWAKANPIPTIGLMITAYVAFFKK